ncbi:MAG TPA: hypothetical protein DEP42_01045 [Ruminococcaceae bacterium]|nr:hypothetical protein [Oscillospiraceae bacterium]
MSQADDIKLEKFSSGVLNDAKEELTKATADVEDFRKKEMQGTEEKVLHEAYDLIQAKIADIHTKQSRQVSLAELEGRRKLLLLRDQMMQKTFDEVAEKIKAYTQTAEYSKWLCDTLQKSCKSMPAGSLIVQVKSGEITPNDQMTAAAGRDSVAIEESSKVTLGGFILVNKTKGIVVDETLDQKLHNEEDWFAASSGLSIGI